MSAGGNRAPRPDRSRRAVLAGTASGIAALTLPPFIGRARAAGAIDVSSLGDGFSLLEGTGGNVLALATDAGLVLVDSGAAADREDLLATLGELPADGVAALFNTHWHPDRVGANVSLGGSGARIVAHEKTRLRLTTGYYLPEEDRYAPPLEPAGRPTETFYEAGSANIGGQQIDYAYLIEAHTDGDCYVAFPDANLIAVGDVVSPAGDPVFDWYGGGWLGGRVDALQHLLDISDDRTRFVPARGPVIGRDDVAAEHALSLTLFERMVERVRLGETPREMLEAGILEGLGRDFDDPHRLIYDINKGIWAHHNKLMHDIV